MPETSPPPKELLKDGKSSGRTRWRDRLFSNDGWRGKNGNDREDNDEEVAQFLGGSAPRPKAEGTQTPTEIPRPKSSNTQRPSIAPLESDLGPIQDFYQKPRPPLQKGLMVSFSRTAAFIIGEGGDDADLPAQDVGKYMERSRDHEASQSSQLQRRSTGLTVPDRSRGAIPNDLSELEQTHDRFIRPYDQSSSPQRFPSRTTSQAPQYHDPTMHEMNQKPLPPVGAGASYLQPPNQHGESSPERSLHLGNSLTPTSSPQPPSQSNRRGPSPSRFQNETRGDHNIRVAATEASRTISPSPQPKGIPVANKSHNFRQIARNLGHDALDEFDARVNVVETLFRLSVSGYQDKQDIVFSKWIRAATWWFLLGRQELENAVRSRSKASREYESEQGSALPRGLMQAYVDLAKAWWIVKEVTPHHPDIKKYGNASMPSMVAIIASFGDQELAELVEVHIAIIANLRALTMSMKRNDRLPPQPFELQGQNTQIFLDYPNLPREVVNPDLSFQKATPESHRIVPIPVSDTTRHFCLGRMFAKVSLLNRHNGREEARIPCVVSTLQGKSDGDLLTGIASQDGQVDIVIRNDNHTKRATTWSQVQWSNKSHSIALALSRDLELHLLLADKDFKTLWALCDSHMNARRAFNKQEAEKITFECTLRSFERLETPHEPGAFPQGSIPGCSARVFEHDLGREDAGIPRPGSGFRLAIRTPPTTKSLCTISTDIGGEKPIFLGSCQPEDGPSLTIRSPSSPSCFLEFQSEDELETFRALICNTMKAQGDEPCKPLPLRKHTVTAALVNESAAGTGHEVFRRLPWRSLQVVSRKELEDGLSSLPPRRLQLIVDSGLGYLVDDLRLGKYLTAPLLL